MTTTAHARPSSRQPVRLALLLVVPVVAAALMTIFAGPTSRLAPRDLPIAVAGPPAVARDLDRALTAVEHGFDVQRLPDEAAARRAIADRDVYGAVVATPTGSKVLVASAASPVVAQFLREGLGGSGTSAVQDVVPASRAAAALPSAVLPLVIAALVTALLSGVLAAGSTVRRTGILVAGAVAAGAASATVLGPWLDVLRGGWITTAAALALNVLAIAAFVAGLHAVLGERGVALGALSMVLVGNPFSGVSSAPDLLPRPIGAIGQLMPPGAGTNLLRSTGLFDGHGAGRHAAVLAVWALVGATLLTVAAFRRRHTGPVPRVRHADAVSRRVTRRSGGQPSRPRRVTA